MYVYMYNMQARISAVHYLFGTQPLLLHLLHFSGVDIILYVHVCTNVGCILLVFFAKFHCVSTLFGLL